MRSRPRPDVGDPCGEHRDELVLGAARGNPDACHPARGELLDQRVIGPQCREIDRPFGVAEQGLADLGTHSLREIVLVSEPHPDLRSM